MFKRIVFLSLFFVVIILSCKKDKTCVCQHYRDGVLRATSEDITTGDCSELNSNTEVNDTTYCVSCAEK
jgi:hypothetical protein